MGHRALLAYRREADDDSLDSEDDSADAEPVPEDDSTCEEGNDARYDLHRSHWGGANFALLGSLSADAPFASDTHVAVDPEPVATDLALDEIVTNYLDFLHHEAFYRVGLDYETTAYHVLWFGLEADCEAVERSETVGHGALIEAHPDDADYLRGWFRGTKSVVAEMVDREAFAPDELATIASEESADADTEEPPDSAFEDSEECAEEARNGASEDSEECAEEPSDGAPADATETAHKEATGTVSEETTGIAPRDPLDVASENAAQFLAERAETWDADREVILPD